MRGGKIPSRLLPASNENRWLVWEAYARGDLVTKQEAEDAIYQAVDNAVDDTLRGEDQ